MHTGPSQNVGLHFRNAFRNAEKEEKKEKKAPFFFFFQTVCEQVRPGIGRCCSSRRFGAGTVEFLGILDAWNASHCGTETSSGPKNDECTSQNSEHTNAAPRPSAAEKELKSALEFADRTKCRLEPELVPPQIISSNNSFCQPKELDRERKEMRKDLNTVAQDDVDSDPELFQPQKGTQSQCLQNQRSWKKWYVNAGSTGMFATGTMNLESRRTFSRFSCRLRVMREAFRYLMGFALER